MWRTVLEESELGGEACFDFWTPMDLERKQKLRQEQKKWDVVPRVHVSPDIENPPGG